MLGEMIPVLFLRPGALPPGLRPLLKSNPNHDPRTGRFARGGAGAEHRRIAVSSWLQHKAVDNCRSLAGEIAYRLEQSRVAEEQQQPQGAQQ